MNFFFYSTTFQGWVLLAGARLTGEGCHVTVCPGEGGGVKLKEQVCVNWCAAQRTLKKKYKWQVESWKKFSWVELTGKWGALKKSDIWKILNKFTFVANKKVKNSAVVQGSVCGRVRPVLAWGVLWLKFKKSIMSQLCAVYVWTIQYVFCCFWVDTSKRVKLVLCARPPRKKFPGLIVKCTW